METIVGLFFSFLQRGFFCWFSLETPRFLAMGTCPTFPRLSDVFQKTLPNWLLETFLKSRNFFLSFLGAKCLCVFVGNPASFGKGARWSNEGWDCVMSVTYKLSQYEMWSKCGKIIMPVKSLFVHYVTLYYIFTSKQGEFCPSEFS